MQFKHVQNIYKTTLFAVKCLKSKSFGFSLNMYIHVSGMAKGIYTKANLLSTSTCTSIFRSAGTSTIIGLAIVSVYIQIHLRVLHVHIHSLHCS